ncbi:MAG: PHP domain-containing protein [Candidatus Desulfofervidaceae bacterium]|nr:PHP domain-containing protein [Candidatus Desulfofervidaceae bacterium]
MKESEALIDLHTHSTASDGSFTPKELVSLAKEVGLKAVALTDHDTVAGLEEFMQAGEKLGIETVPGVELSAHFEKGTLHILGYFLDFKDKYLLTELQKFQKARTERNPKIVKKLQDLGIPITYEEVVAASGGGQVGRPHFAKVLLAKGIVKSFDEAFERFLKKGAPAYVEKERIYPKECIELLLHAKGIPVLAHPFTLYLDNEALEAFVKQLKDWGLGGIEVYYTEHTPKQVAFYLSLAQKYDLCITGGSDFHGKNKEEIKLGFGYGNLRVPYRILEKLKEVKHAKYGRNSASRN